MDAKNNVNLNAIAILEKLEMIEAFAKDYKTKALIFEDATWGDVAELAFVDSKLAEILGFLNNEQE